MIKKNWSDQKAYEFCKENKRFEFFNKGIQGDSIEFFKTKFTYDSAEFKVLKQWCLDNCEYMWDWTQWQYGFGNTVWFRFFSSSEAKSFKRMYELTHYRRLR